jgi:hypothetical protein
LVDTSCTIFDFQGIGLRSITQLYGYLQAASKIGQDNFPERMGMTVINPLKLLGKFYLINAPWGFATVWNVVKHLLDPVTAEKITILDSSYRSTLLQQIPAENLPSQLGGQCQCPGGCELSDAGPWRDPQWTKIQDKDAVAPVVEKDEASTTVSLTFTESISPNIKL